MTIGTPDSARMMRQTSMPGQLGEHQVEQDEVRPLGTELDERLAAVGRRHDPESVGLERVDQRLAQCRLVVDDQDRSCHLPFRIAADVNGSFAADPTARLGAAQAAQWPSRSLSGSSMKYSMNSTHLPCPSKRSAKWL